MASYSREELESAAGRIFHNTVQLFGYYAWIAKVAPALKAHDEKVTERLYFNVAQNAVVDGYLINLRRLNEFFSRPPKHGSERDDDLRAYHFGCTGLDRFLDPQDMEELHKRIAHSTSLTSTSGVAYEALQATELGLKHSFKFIEFLVTKFFQKDSPQEKQYLDGAIRLLALWREWQDAAKAEAQAKAGRHEQ